MVLARGSLLKRTLRSPVSPFLAPVVMVSLAICCSAKPGLRSGGRKTGGVSFHSSVSREVTDARPSVDASVLAESSLASCSSFTGGSFNEAA
uniref:Putative secreted protein n=1 Tax=Anopheles marajoara TaxID=58244 RepID=A0A2M4CAV2_9DIPT